MFVSFFVGELVIKILVDTDGSISTTISAKQWAEWINEFVDEKAYLVTQKKLSVQEEAKWLASEIAAMEKKEKMKIIAVDGAQLVGVCDVRKLKPIEVCGHNATFGLAVKKDYRRQGIGKKLLLRGIEEAKKLETKKHLHQCVRRQHTCQTSL